MEGDSLTKGLQYYIDTFREEEEYISFPEYLDRIKNKPTIASLAHQRIFDMIESYGVIENREQEQVRYKFFESELFGIEDSTKQIMEYFKAAALGSEVGRRFLLLYGPPSSGKSCLLTMVKRGLEKWSHTDAGALYSIKGCPMHEQPLNAIPKSLRKQVQKDLGVKLDSEASLCPACAYKVKHELNGDFLKLQVHRKYVSEAGRVGIGTFVPSDPKSQDVSELIGGIDLSKVADYGDESDPRAWKFNGELNIANRGLVEFVEILKVDQKFLYVLLTATQEKQIKTPRYPLLYVDEAIISHSVIGDSPIPYRKNGFVCISSIRELCDKNDTDIEVLASGRFQTPVWTRVKSFHRHQFSGKIVRTLQADGTVDTTWHHSLIGKDGRPFLPEEKKDILAFRSIPDTLEISCFSLPLPQKMETKEGYICMSTTGDRKRDGEFGKYKIKSTYNCDTQEALDILSILCWYATEGHVTDTHAIISQADTRILYSLKESIERISTTTGSIHDRSERNDGTSRLHLSSRIWKEILKHNCGIHSQNKRLPDFILNLPRDLREFVFRCLIQGDGQTVPSFCAGNQYKKKYFGFKTTSPILAAQFSYLAISLGYDFGMSHSYTKNGKQTFGFGYREHIRMDNRINRIEEFEVDDVEVFDIECIDNHSFVSGIGNVVCHNTNETEYKEFVGNPKNEALIDRMIVCRVPYNLRVDDEIKIYQKLFSEGDTGDVHVAPHTFRVAAIFAVLSRLEDPKEASLDKIKKMKLYNGEEVEGFSLKDVPRLKREHPMEGMDGASPRYVINRLITTAIRASEDKDSSGKIRPKFITPVEAIRALKDGLQTSSKFGPEQQDRFNQFLQLTKKEFDNIARNEVQKAFFVSFEDEARALLNNYLNNVEAYLEGVKLEDPITHEEVDADEKLMRGIETKIGISENQKDSFRNEILRKVGIASRRGEDFRYEDHARLREAIEKELFETKRDVINITISSRSVKDPEQLRRINDVIKVLCEKHGYIEESANELLKYVSSMMAREK